MRYDTTQHDAIRYGSNDGLTYCDLDAFAGYPWRFSCLSLWTTLCSSLPVGMLFFQDRSVDFFLFFFALPFSLFFRPRPYIKYNVDTFHTTRDIKPTAINWDIFQVPPADLNPVKDRRLDVVY